MCLGEKVKRLLLLFLYFFAFCFFAYSCKDISNNSNKNTNLTTHEATFLIPNDYVISLKDTRPYSYNVRENNGTLIEHFNSLYTAIDYIIKNPRIDAYITKSYGADSDKKLFVYNQYPENMYFYQDGVSLDEILPQESCYMDSLYNKDDIIAVSNKIPNHIMHSFEIINRQSQDLDLISFINPQKDAFLVSKAQANINKLTYKIELSSLELYPSFNKNQPVYAKIGFNTLTDNAIFSFGMMCDTQTGNWFYFDSENELDTNACVLTSLWNKANGCFTPTEDVTMSFETQHTADAQKDINNLLTLNFSSGREYIFDISRPISNNAQVSFFAGLDIVSEQDVPDYMNGAKMQNLKITQAYGYADNDKGNEKINLIKNDIVRTLLYNTASITADFSNQDFDKYNFSYLFDSNTSVYSKTVTAVQNMIDSLKAEKDITAEDKEAIKTARKEYDKLRDNQKQLINAQKLYEAKNAYLELFEGYEKVVAVADNLKPFLDADKEYVIENADIVFDAWDIYYNQLDEEQQDKLPEPKLARLSAYYNHAFGLKLQAENVIIAIDSLNAKSTKREILSVYEKYFLLSDVQIERIIGADRSLKLIEMLKKINPKVINAVNMIIQLGYAESSDYAVYYGLNNYQTMIEMIQGYRALTKAQANILPKKSKKIYQTASNYFYKQIGYMERLKKGITSLKTDSDNYKDDVKKLMKIYNTMDVSSKWHFKNDCIFEYSQYYEKLEKAVIELGLTM